MSRDHNRRLATLEARRAATRVGREIDRRRPHDRRNDDVWLKSLSDDDLDELTRYHAAEHPGEVAAIEALTDAELDASIDDLERQLTALEGDDDLDAAVLA